MARIVSAKKLARRALGENGESVRNASFRYMLLMMIPAALLAGGFLIVDFAPASAFSRILQTYSLCFLALPLYAFFWVGLWINAPMTAAAHHDGASAYRNMTRGRWLVFCLLPVSQLLAVSLTIALLDFANREWQTIFASMFNTVPRITLFIAIALLVLAAVIWLNCAMGVFSRHMAIYLLENNLSASPRAVPRALLNGFRYAFSSVRLAFSYIQYYLAMLAMALVLSFAAFVTLTLIAGQPIYWSSLNLLLMQYINFLIQRPAAAHVALWAASCVWMLGAGFVFWPRCHMTRVYYHRKLMRESGLL